MTYRQPTAYLIFFVLIVFLLQGCTNVFFQPMKPLLLTPKAANLSYEDIYFKSTNDVTLHAWFLPSKTPAKGTVFFLHGNAENISTHLGSVYWLPEEGFNVFIWDYRGYGNSSGQPSLPGIISDVESALSELVKRDDINSDKIIVFGQSLGAALAIYVVSHSAYQNNIKAVIIDSAFSGYRTIAQEKLSELWLTWPLQWPLSLLVMNKYDPINVVSEIAPIPVLFIYSQSDKVIPPRHGEDLFNRANTPKERWVLENVPHIQSTISPEFRRRFVKYMENQLNN